jgi:hypothetical protein
VYNNLHPDKVKGYVKKAYISLVGQLSNKRPASAARSRAIEFATALDYAKNLVMKPGEYYQDDIEHQVEVVNHITENLRKATAEVEEEEAAEKAAEKAAALAEEWDSSEASGEESGEEGGESEEPEVSESEDSD